MPADWKSEIDIGCVLTVFAIVDYTSGTLLISGEFVTDRDNMSRGVSAIISGIKNVV
jgi:hypothetical protein